MTAPDALIRLAAERLRAGDLAGARAALDAALASHPHEPLLHAFAGMAACRAGDLRAGAAHLGRAVALRPDDRASRANLVTALLDLGETDRAEAACLAADPGGDPRLLRYAGWFHARAGRQAEAADAYAAVVLAQPDDAESWNNLGNAHAALDRWDEALAAFARAAFLRPRDARPRVNALRALGRADRRAERLAQAEAAVAALPDEAELRLQLGLAAAAMGENGAAEAALRTAIRLAPGDAGAYLELGLLLENLNRLDDLDALVAQGERAGAPEGEIGFLKAWSLRRRGRFAAALPLAEAAPDTIDPIRRAQLLGDLADRLGDADRAFGEYSRMKALTARLVSPTAMADGAAYLAEVRAAAAAMTPAAAARWAPAPPPARTPVFIAGFPRSGTTLLDTLLMNAPGLHVCEELSMMRAAELAAGDAPPDTLDAAAVGRLRAAYWAELARVAPAPDGATVVDKFPLHMARLGLIHRLFPDAPVIFCQRHPLDVLLSCFVSNFQPNRAMVNFLTLEGSAALYDAAFDGWTRARAALPAARVHEVRYERLVENPAGRMRALLEFLGLPWDERVLDNQASAARRGAVRTASYAQVTEPIYRRSAGRWRRYRRHLEPVMPVMAPWVKRLGYAIGE